MMEHWFRVVELHNGDILKRRLVMEFDEEHELIGRFITFEVPSFYDEIMDAITAVYDGRDIKSGFSGNVISLAILTDLAVVYEEDDLGEISYCKTELKELYELISEYRERELELIKGI